MKPAREAAHKDGEAIARRRTLRGEKGSEKRTSQRRRKRPAILLEITHNVTKRACRGIHDALRRVDRIRVYVRILLIVLDGRNERGWVSAEHHERNFLE